MARFYMTLAEIAAEPIYDFPVGESDALAFCEECYWYVGDDGSCGCDQIWEDLLSE